MTLDVVALLGLGVTIVPGLPVPLGLGVVAAGGAAELGFNVVDGGAAGGALDDGGGLAGGVVGEALGVVGEGGGGAGVVDGLGGGGGAGVVVTGHTVVPIAMVTVLVTVLPPWGQAVTVGGQEVMVEMEVV